MDLKDRMRKTSSGDYSNAPFRQNGADRNNFTSNSMRTRNPNRQAPRSVQYQPEFFEPEQNENIEQPLQNNIPQQDFTQIPPQPIYSQPQQTQFAQQPVQQPLQPPVQPQIPQPVMQEPLESNDDLDINSLFDSKTNTPNIIPQNVVPQNVVAEPVVEKEKEELHKEILKTEPQNVQTITSEEVKKEFENEVVSLFNRYDIDKVLIVNNKIYTVNFVSDEDEEIFEEKLNASIINNFITTFVENGYYEELLPNNCKLEILCSPISDVPTIIISKTNTETILDEEFIGILFEFLSKGKNVAILSPCILTSLFKATTDFLEKNLCVTINEPIKTNNNIAFRENSAKPSLKTVFSVTQKIEPDNTIIFCPNDMFSSINFMKKNSRVVIFTENTNPSDFINSDVFNCLGGFNDYNKVSILKSVDIIFTVSMTKNDKLKYTATQLLSASNKSHINKIKHIIGDAEIDNNKIYFNNIFEKEV